MRRHRRRGEAALDRPLGEAGGGLMAIILDHRLMISPEPFDPLDVAVGPSRASGSPVPVIVQFTAPLTIPDVDRLRAAYEGLALDRYVPNLAYLERLPDTVVAALREDFLVRACVPLDPAQKRAQWLTAPAGSPLDLSLVLITDAGVDAVRSALIAVGAREVGVFDDRPTDGAVRAWCTIDDPASLAQITAMTDVVWVEPAAVPKSFDVKSARMTQSGTVGNAGNPIWDKGLHGEGQVIGIIDELIPDIIHSFLFDPAHPAPGPDNRKLLANMHLLDIGESDHFMFVAGIAAGDSWLQPGTHPHRGGAWAAKLVCSNYHDLRQVGSLYRMLKQVAAKGATVHNLSWGDAFLEGKVVTVYNTTCRDVDRFSWENEGHLVVCAGANSNEADNSPPGIAKNTLCVACAEAHPNHMSRGSGINGPTNPDRRRKPEIMAVGCDIESALLDPRDKLKTGLLTTRGRCSTSWAAPNVSAAAALVRQYFAEGWYPKGERDEAFAIPDPSGALIKAVLLNSTVDMAGDPQYPSPMEGWGLIQLDRVLYFAGGARRLAVRDVRNEYGMESGEVRHRYLLVGSSVEKLKITLVWTDPPAAALTTSPAVNNIQLTVTDPNGVAYRGNDIDPSVGLSRPNGTGAPDTVNNVHMVIVSNPPIGVWRLTTRATVAKGDTQGFALVATGGLLMNIFVP
jgi:hypothetical protein